MRPAFRRGNLQNAGYAPTRHPQIWLSDGPHGLRKQAGRATAGLNPSVPATCFPTASAVANSWDAALGEEIGAALGEEAAAQEVSVVLGPGLNMKRNPLCRRSFEYFSEDPYLAGKLAAGYIRGIQSKGVAACEALCRQQSGNAAYGFGFHRGRAHPAGNLPDRV